MTTELSPPYTARTSMPARMRSLRVAVPIGRALFALIFLLAAPSHFSAATIGYASVHGVPFAGILVPFAGVLALLGGLSVLFGFRARVGALLLVLFLLPVTFTMHAFWGIVDPQMAMLQRVMFLKNLSMLGGALLLLYYGGGPISMDTRATRRRTPPEPEPT
jgi:putative oxidoreductase